MPSCSQGRVAVAIVVLLALTYFAAIAGPSSAGGHNPSATTAVNDGPARDTVLNSKYVARQIFKTPCRRVRVQVRSQTPNPRYLGEAIPPCGVVIRRGLYTFRKICALIVHEYGHLAGHEHSSNPHHIMHPAIPRRYPPCVRHEALLRRRAARAKRL